MLTHLATHATRHYNPSLVPREGPGDEAITIPTLRAHATPIKLTSSVTSYSSAREEEDERKKTKSSLTLNLNPVNGWLSVGV